MKRKLITISLVILISCHFAFAQSEAEKVARDLLIASGSGKIGVQVANQMLAMQKQTLPDVPDAFWVEVSKEIKPEELINLIVPIYVKHYSLAEMKEMIKFYRSPIGKKIVEKTPIISQESMVAGQQWGLAIGQKIVKKLQEKGYK